MKKKRASGKATRQESFILILALVLIIGSMTITIIDKQLEIRKQKQEKARKLEALTQQLQENDHLQEVLDNPDKSDYIEQVAREDLGYGYQNEKVFYDITPGE